MEFLAVFIGGGLGSILRFAISKWMGVHETSGFPLGTFCANVLSCVVLALAWNYFSNQVNFSPYYKSLILVGFCGGFSTFSTFSYETFRLFQQGNYATALLYVGLSMGVCVFVLWILLKK